MRGRGMYFAVFNSSLDSARLEPRRGHTRLIASRQNENQRYNHMRHVTKAATADAPRAWSADSRMLTGPVTPGAPTKLRL